MRDSGKPESGERPQEQDSPAGSPAQAADTAGSESPGASPGRAVRAVAYLAAAALTLGVGFGLTKLVDPPRAAPLPAVIPSPAKSGGVFTEDDDETGQDSQDNIFRSTVPGLVHVLSGGKAVGIGLVLTPSGKVLTTYQPPGGAGKISAKYVASGATFEATVLGTDPAAGLTLLQLAGGDGRPSQPWRSGTPMPWPRTRTIPGSFPTTSPARSWTPPWAPPGRGTRLSSAPAC